MEGQSNRLPSGGLIDRSRPLRFTFDGRTYEGFQGDTLASALLANGVRVVGRSFKYHRPRGLMAAGVEEPNAIVTVGDGDHAMPNLKATEVELVEGLVARPVNCWPSARHDAGALMGLLGRFMPSGFYYKTFMWPNWHWYEGAVRRAAGLGTAPAGPDPEIYEHHYAHCDVLVVGSGPAGLAAAVAAAASGARVMVVEQEAAFGGCLLTTDAVIDGLPGRAWLAQQLRALGSLPEVTLLSRTTATGYYDHNALSLLERVTAGSVRQRLWQVRARRVVLATGALERPLVFPDNDRPGIMLLSAMRRYAAQYGVAAGRRAMVFTNNDTAYDQALALHRAGIAIAAVVDCRAPRSTAGVTALERAGIPLIWQGVVEKTHGRAGLTGVTVATPAGRRRLACDVLGMSGGWNPVVHLHSQAGGSLSWDEAALMFTPEKVAQACRSVGAGNGQLALADCLADGYAAGIEAARLCGLPVTDGTPPTTNMDGSSTAIQALWQVPGGKAWVDFQNDVTAGDVMLAAQENFRSVEHLKRYTTLGMAVDQGKTSNINGLAILAEQCGRTIPQTGTTRFRPPYTPVTLGAFRGAYRADLFRPRRLMPVHEWHQAHGAVFEDFGGWQRPVHYLRPGEGREQAMHREIRAVRTAAGLFEGSPLGKIEVRGPDAAEFLDRIYVNTMSTLKPGRLRYGLMTNENGIIIDDGVVARLGPDHFLVGTTGGNAGRIAEWLEEWLQCEWVELRVVTLPVTTAWATLTLTGPRARAILERAGVDFDIGAAAFPHMSFRDGHVAGIPTRVCRVSFTGEVSYEINVPAGRATTLWQRIMWEGAPLGLQPVGIDAWMDLRTEKGYLHVGADTDGTTTPLDVGWGPAIARKAKDFVGKRSLLRSDNARADRLNFVGLEPVDGVRPIPIGAHLRFTDVATGPTDGHVTSACISDTLGRPIALAMVRGGRERMGQTVRVLAPAGAFQARIVSPLFHDPEGDRLNA